MKRWIIILTLVAAGIAGYFGYHYIQSKDDSGSNYRTAKIERGDVIQTVRATGTIQPIRLVQVGTQVNGPIRKLYVDYNTQVKKGDLVAQIDPTTYEARLAQDQANLTESHANVEQTQAKLLQAEKELERAQKLTAREMLSQADLDTAIATRDALQAQLKVAQAAVQQAEASLRLSKANLGYTTISSPVDGIVIDRNVDEGQTVVASMSAQVLFLIATDLSRIQVEASIPEADIGKIAVGQCVTFTVDAFDEPFTGKVAQIRMAAAKVQNVVTYPVVIEADNPGKKLFPSMTADIICEVAHRSDVLKVPNAALRFKPSATGSRDAAAPAAPRISEGHRVWVYNDDGKNLKPVPVSVGITDGSFTEIKGDPLLAEGQDVITGTQISTNENKTVNPFAPQMPSRQTRRATH